MKILLAIVVCLFTCWMIDLNIEPSLYKPKDNWKPIFAHVTSVRPFATSPDNPQSVIVYSFALNGTNYEHYIYQKFPIHDMTGDPSVEALRDKRILAYYDPADPHQSTSMEIGKIYAAGNSFVLGIIFIAVGVGMFFYVLFKEMSQFGGGDRTLISKRE